MTGLPVTILALLIAIVNLTSAVEYYSDVYDNVDICAILRNKRLSKQYVDCILDKGPCTADARSLRRNLPDAVATHCAKCSPQQLVIAKELYYFLKFKEPESYWAFLDMYDPERSYVEQFEERLETVPSYNC